MSVYENMAITAWKLRKYPKEEIKQRVHEAAEILGIEEYLTRKPKQLSGGQRQRVALGRAIVRKPKVFLFDEPLSNLDAKMRVQMRAEISKLHIRLQATMIYVTHDQVEAMTMADRIVVMKDGLVQPGGRPPGPLRQAQEPLRGRLHRQPQHELHRRHADQAQQRPLLQRGQLPGEAHRRGRRRGLGDREGEAILEHPRPEDIYDKVYATNASPDNTLTATVEVVEPMGSESYIYLTTGKTPFVARFDTHDQVEVNTDIELVFDMSKAHVFDPSSGETLY